MASAAEVIQALGLQPLPSEGTLFKATYRAASGACSNMLGLYCEDPPSHSLFHRLPVDEIWHHCGGDALRLVVLHPGGGCEEIVLGADLMQGQRAQCVVPANCWQAGHRLPGGTQGWALFGCTVVPAFDSQMFEGGSRDVLLAGWPQRAADIDRLACAPGELRMPVLPGELPR